MEIKAYVFANENALYAQYGWVYLFVSEVCDDTELGVEVIDLESYNKFHNNKSMLKRSRAIVARVDLAPMPLELLEKYEACMYDDSGKDMSDQMRIIADDVIEAHKVIKNIV